MDKDVILKAQAKYDELEAKATPLERSCNSCSLLKPFSNDYICTAKPKVPANTMQYIACDTEVGRQILRTRLERWPNTTFSNCDLWEPK